MSEKKTCSCGNGQGSCGCGQKNWGWIALGLLVVGGLMAARILAPRDRAISRMPVPAVSTAGTNSPAAPVSGLPRLVDLGADKCIPCKLMAPILKELRQTYSNDLEVTFIDVWKNPEAGEEYGIQIIPTQIFYGSDGKERFRHQGFYSREEILAKWKELGVVLNP